MSEIRGTMFKAPLMRFMLELTTWVWLLILGLETFNFSLVDSQERTKIDSWIFLALLILSVFLLSQFNFPGDKKPHGKMVSGWQRIGVEIFSACIGIFAAWILFGSLGIIFQTSISVVAFYFDRERWKWFLDYREEPPDFVLVLGNYFPKEA